MKVCMVTTFYPPYAFGGDATYVQRLAHALAGRGHTVDVIHDRDAFHLAHPAEPQPAPPEPTGVQVYPMKSPWGRLSPLLTHQTARSLLKPELRRRLSTTPYDVVHFHNASLIGADAFAWGDAVKLYTAHEYWLLCPLSLLWKYGRERCTSRACVSCTLRAGRPPQWWRQTGYLRRQLAAIDCFIAPSAYVRDKHGAWGLDLRWEVLPSFVPAAAERDTVTPAAPRRPYFLFVGRLVTIKGLHTLIEAFRHYPDADLLVAGTGEQEAALRQQATGLASVQFLGSQSRAALRALYAGAIALVMPSVCDEVFGLVLIEAMAEGTPVIARGIAGMAEVVRDSGGGLLYDDEAGLLVAMRALQYDHGRRAELAARGRTAVATRYAEVTHLTAYLDLVTRLQAQRRSPAERR